MPSIHVCSLALVDETVRATGAQTLITLLQRERPDLRPASIAPERHLVLSLADIVEAADGHILPAEDHVAELIAFVRGWDRREPLVIHCFAGVSRSTAAAFTAACILMPERSEAEIAAEIRAASPTATPNALIVRHADDLLGRRGRMVAAIEAIGRGAECSEGVPFALTLR